MSAFRRSRPSHDEGAAAVEFALVLPVLVLIMFGILQFGLYFYRWQGIQAMAHEGARGASVGLSIAEITDRIEKSMAIPAQFADVVIEVTLTDQTGANPAITIDGKTTDVGEQATSLCEGLINPRNYTIRVEVGLDPTLSTYDVLIPLWGNLQTNYGSAGTFGCEASA